MPSQTLNININMPRTATAFQTNPSIIVLIIMARIGMMKLI